MVSAAFFEHCGMCDEIGTGMRLLPMACFIYKMIPDSLTSAACNLINNDMKQFIVTSETDPIREVEERV